MRSSVLALLVLQATPQEEPVCVSGIYPHLAAFNGNGECGIGAVVPWAGKLWWITYPPHQTRGGSDKLYAVGPDLRTLEIRPESVGGTHASRLIHRESNQLIIGPYFIDAEGRVRAADVKGKLVGRMTATARHLTDPANLVYFYDMEGAVYEVEVRTLEVKKLFSKPVPGWHGKGAYTAQGRLVVANNGEAHVGSVKEAFLAKLPPPTGEDFGVLAEWDGKEWRILERRQFLDVTGPGGIHGAPDDRAPLWSFGWDKRSVILKLLDGGVWSTYRLPKGSYSFDPSHGWYTEWPRIREVADGRFLMVAHGSMFDFPRTFSRANSAGLRPICTHLRYVPDFCAWNGKLIIASDDTSIMRNPLAGQAQSNLWFGKMEELKEWGPSVAWGGVWMGDPVKKDASSDPFLFAGHAQRVLHLSHRAEEAVIFTVEFDAKGDGRWETLEKIEVPARSYRYRIFPAGAPGEWVRLKADRDCTVSAYFHLANPNPFAPPKEPPRLEGAKPALVRPAKESRNLQVFTPSGFYEVDEKLVFAAKELSAEATVIRPKMEIASDFTVDAASVILTDPKGQRWRLPKIDAEYDAPPTPVRGLREVQSERFLANWHGILYEIPRLHVGGDSDQPDYRKMKPVATHRAALTDFCTWRGLLVLAGGAAVPGAGRVVTSADGKANLWFGKVDDLWRFGKPVGQGGPWRETAVQPGKPSDPCLMTNFDRKTLVLSHHGTGEVTFTVEVDFMANGTWREYARFPVKQGEKFGHTFPAGYGAHWVRLTVDSACTATAVLNYE